jgi:hypothetical protein
MTLAELGGLDTDALITIDLRNVDGAAGRLTLGGHRVEIPTDLRALVRAQLLCRAAARLPTTPDAPLFVHVLGRRATASELAEWIRQATSTGPIRRETPWLDGPRVYGRMLLIRGEPRRVPLADIGRADRNRY